MSKRLQKLRYENSKLLCRLMEQRERLLTQLSRVHINLLKARSKEARYAKLAMQREDIATQADIELFKDWNGKRLRLPIRPLSDTILNDPLDDIPPRPATETSVQQEIG